MKTEFQMSFNLQLESISEAFKISFTESQILLYFHNWNLQKLSDEILQNENADQLLYKLGYIPSNQQILEYVNSDEDICQICFCNKAEIAYSCQHKSCNQCFQQYLTNELKNSPFPRCFGLQCKFMVPYKYFSCLEQYKQQIKLSQNKLETKCYKCQQLLLNVSFENSYIQCSCGTMICIICQRKEHGPLNCLQAQLCKNEIKQNKFKGFKVKNCPKCLLQIQKNGGCNKMVCKPPSGCNYQFCWICLTDWAPYHYQCKEKQLSKQQLLESKQKKKSKNFITQQWNKIIKNDQDMQVIVKSEKFANHIQLLGVREQYYFQNIKIEKDLSKYHETFEYIQLKHYTAQITKNLNLKPQADQEQNILQSLQIILRTAKLFYNDYLIIFWKDLLTSQ